LKIAFAFDVNAMPMDRAITPIEADVVRWVLDHASVCDVTAYRRHAVEKLHVVGGCGCGCASLYFKPEGQLGKVHMLADAVAVYPDGQKAGLILWGREAEIVWLEVYDFQPESSRRVPEVSTLCTWEELGRNHL
jgi:hypothetical protein